MRRRAQNESEPKERSYECQAEPRVRFRHASVRGNFGASAGSCSLAQPIRCARRAQYKPAAAASAGHRSEEHTSELQSLMRISYAVFCLKKKTSRPQKEPN